MHMGKDTELLLHVCRYYTSLRIMHIKVLHHNNINQGRERVGRDRERAVAYIVTQG